MFKKICLCVSLVFLFFISFSLQVNAENPNVKDCLEGTLDCDEEEGVTESENNDDQDLVGHSNGSLFFNIVQMFFALILILALIYFVLKFLKKRNKIFNQVKALDNIGGISVGPNKSIQVIKVGNKLYLVGVGDNVDLLQEITDESVKQDLLSHHEEESPNFLAKIMQQQSNKDSMNNTQDNGRFKELFSHELEKMKANRKALIDQNKQKDGSHE